MVTPPNLEFADNSTDDHLHGVHPYPARMPPLLAQYLIRKTGGSGVVLDPFCGSGTVLLEAKLLGRDSLGIDVNPLAVFLSRLKVNPPTTAEIEKLRVPAEALPLKIGPRQIDERSLRRLINLPLVSYWFHPYLLRQLVFLRTVLSNDFLPICSVRERLLVLIAFSNTVRLSSEIRTTEYKLYRMDGQHRRKHHPNAIRIFQNELGRMTSSISDYWKQSRSRNLGTARVRLGDSSTFDIDTPVSSIVTSPPYGDHSTTIAYGQFSRLPLMMLDFPIEAVEKVDEAMYASLRPRTIKKALNSSVELCDLVEHLEKLDPGRMRDVLAYFCMILRTMSNASDQLSEGGGVAVVVGERTVRDLRVPTPAIVMEIMHSLGYKRTFSVERTLPKKMLPPRNGQTHTINKEMVLVFRK